MPSREECARRRAFAGRLRAQMSAHGAMAKDVEAAIGMSQSQFSAHARGIVPPPGRRTVEEMARAIGCEAGDLTGEEEAANGR